MTILPKKNDVLFAHKALNLLPGLSVAGRRVAGALIDHFNKKDGRCYPGVERLCKLLGLSKASVLRATKILHERKIIAKLSHGGPNFQASYQPNWDYLRTVVADWDAKMKSTSRNRETNNAPASTKAEASKTEQSSKSRAYNQVLGGLATPKHETSRPEKTDDESYERTYASIAGLRIKTLSNEEHFGGKNFPTNSFPARPSHRRFSPSRREVSRQMAQRRWERDAQNLGEKRYCTIVEWMTPDRQEAATDAELEAKGGGLRFIVKAMVDDQSISARSDASVRLGGAHETNAQKPGRLRPPP